VFILFGNGTLHEAPGERPSMSGRIRGALVTLAKSMVSSD